MACAVVGGCTVYVLSAHEEVRRAAAALALDAGRSISRLSSELLVPSAPSDGDAAAAAEPQKAAAADGAPPPQFVRDEQLLHAHLELLLAALGGGQPHGCGCTSLQAAAGSVAVPREFARLERSLTMVCGLASYAASQMCKLQEAPTSASQLAPAAPMRPPLSYPAAQAAYEPPWLGLCSQPGANLQAYAAVQRELQLLGGAIFCLRATCSGGSLCELAGGAGLAPPLKALLHSALATALATAAAACMRASEALTCMGSGPVHWWRPTDAARFAECCAALAAAGAQLSAAFNASLLDDPTTMSLDLRQGRTLLFTLPAAVQAMHRVQELEAAVASALEVGEAAAAVEQQPPQGAVDPPDLGKDSKIEDKCGEVLGDPEAPPVAAATGYGTAAHAGATPAAQHPSPPASWRGSLRRLLGSPYAINAANLLWVASSAKTWTLVVQSNAAALRALPTLRSRQALRKGVWVAAA